MLPAGSKHFGLAFTGFRAPTPSGNPVTISVSFDDGKTMSFTGMSYRASVLVPIADSDVAEWTNEMTAGQLMTVSFPEIHKSNGHTDPAWSIPLTGATATVTALAAAMGQAGINGLPPPWNIMPGSKSTGPNAGLAPQPANTAAGATLVPPPSIAPSSATDYQLQFTDPNGKAYAALEETTWSTQQSHNEMTDQTDVTIVSDQQNDQGVLTQIVGSCSNNYVTFKATIADSSGVPTINLEQDEQDALGRPYVGGNFRLNSQPEATNSFKLDLSSNRIVVARFSIGGGIDPTTQELLYDVASTWRILAELNTDHGQVLIKIPMYDPQIESFLEGCVDTAPTGTQRSGEGYFGALVADFYNSGALITALVPNGPAYIAGLKTGDVVSKIDGKPVMNANDFNNALQKFAPGQNADMEIESEGIGLLGHPVLVTQFDKIIVMGTSPSGLN